MNPLLAAATFALHTLLAPAAPATAATWGPADFADFTKVAAWHLVLEHNEQPTVAEKQAIAADPNGPISSALLDAALALANWQAQANQGLKEHPEQTNAAAVAWQPTLARQSAVCGKHISGNSDNTTDYDQAFSSACPSIDARWRDAKDEVAWVLVQREQASDLAVVNGEATK